jgi:hypothetical protein
MSATDLKYKEWHISTSSCFLETGRKIENKKVSVASGTRKSSVCVGEKKNRVCVKLKNLKALGSSHQPVAFCPFARLKGNGLSNHHCHVSNTLATH